LCIKKPRFAPGLKKVRLQASKSGLNNDVNKQHNNRN
jgi:hypothetical protein